jgi:hypothetical protein
MATINSDGKVAYIYNESNDTWYALGGAVNTNAEYTWTADQTFSSVVNFDMVANAKAGVNNFQNPTARDAALTSPTNGIVCFVRQTDGGSVINQIQYYHNGEWRWSGDSADITLKTADYTITKDDAGKTINVSSESPTDITITVPANSTIPFINGQKIEIFRSGTGNVEIEGAVGVTINSKNSNKKIAAQYSGCVLVKTDTNTWLLIGDLTA